MTERITSGPIIHDPRRPLRILGGDPGATTGIAMVEFTQRRIDGSPLWRGARLLGAETITRPERAGATSAERDILFRRRILEAIADTAPNNNGQADIVALEEPVDGGQVYAAKRAAGQRPSTKDSAGGIEARGTSFRIGAAYGALLAAAATQTRANRFVSYPAKKFHDRAGWMVGKRPHIILATTALLRGISTLEQYKLLQKKDGTIADHILMAIGVINHTVEHFLDYFPHER